MTYRFRKNQIIEVEEYHDGNYGAPGKRREKKEKPTQEQMQKVNDLNRTRKCRHKLLEYFDKGDLFLTWTYAPKNRPPDMQQALKDFQKAMRHVRKEFEKRNRQCLWIRNIERGTKGAWHIHMVIKEIGDTAKIVKDAWKLGGTYVCEIQFNENLYDRDFSRLASYLTKTERTVEVKKDGTEGKPRLKESNYRTSQNMPLKKPKKRRLKKWPEQPRGQKGYYIGKIYEGVNPITHYPYRRYTMYRKGGNDEDEHIY